MEMKWRLIGMHTLVYYVKFLFLAGKGLVGDYHSRLLDLDRLLYKCTGLIQVRRLEIWIDEL